jgi:hypothetical protein
MECQWMTWVRRGEESNEKWEEEAEEEDFNTTKMKQAKYITANSFFVRNPFENVPLEVSRSSS